VWDIIPVCKERLIEAVDLVGTVESDLGAEEDVIRKPVSHIPDDQKTEPTLLLTMPSKSTSLSKAHIYHPFLS
jgi:hypothetical protein